MKMLHINRNESVFKGFESMCKLKITREAPPATLLKKTLWHRCFPVNFAKFLRTPLGNCFCMYRDLFIFLTNSYNDALLKSFNIDVWRGSKYASVIIMKKAVVVWFFRIKFYFEKTMTDALLFKTTNLICLENILLGRLC